MNDKRVAETLFIDMKYVFLYHKLGFSEISPDSFLKKYNTCDISLESEEQQYTFNNKIYPLTEHRDFVILELLDLLLDRGYPPSEISVNEIGIEVNGCIPLSIRCEQWGEDYITALKTANLIGTHVIYTSRLSGGLIDREYSFKLDGKIKRRGLFEKNIGPWTFEISESISKNAYPAEYNMNDDTLVEYLGHEEIIHIPDGVKKIEAGAFWNRTFIKEIVLPDSVEVIGGDAFAYCYSLKKVNIPPNVNDMGDDPFAGCMDLIVSNASPYFIMDNGVLYSADRKRLIHYTPCLNSCQFTIPESVEWIGKHSFYKCINLEQVTIGKNVNYMGNNAFSDCTYLTLKNESPHFVYLDGALLNREMTNILHYSHGRDEDEYIVPDTVRTIGRNSFWNCKRIRRIILGRNVRQVGYNPFANCTNLKIISKSPLFKVVDGILYDAELKELFCCTNQAAKWGVNIPNTVINIGRNSFAGCIDLKEILIPNSVKTIGRGAFSNCDSLHKVVLPDSVETIEKWAFSYCKNLKHIEISKSAALANEVFSGSNTDVVIL